MHNTHEPFSQDECFRWVHVARSIGAAAVLVTAVIALIAINWPLT